MHVDANVEGPFGWLDEPTVLSHPLGRLKGVYIWTIPVDGRHIVHYVGMTDDTFRSRMRQHQKAYLSGRYFTYDPAALRKGELKEIWRSMATQEQAVRKPDFQKNSQNLLRAVNETLAMMSVWIIPLDITTRGIKRVEGALGRHLRADLTKTPHLIEPPVTFPKRSPDEEPISVRLSVPEGLAGVPSEFTA